MRTKEPIEMEVVRCDLCNAILSANGASVVGIHIDLSSPNLAGHPETLRLMDTFGRVKFDICFTDWMLALGVKPSV